MPSGRRVAGSIVGGAHALGHRLRDAAPMPAPARREEIPVAILGAGIAGLSAAWAFERAGTSDFTVLELEDGAGGTARSGTGPVSPYPWAAHYVPVPPPHNRPLIALLEEVGAVTGRDAASAPLYAEDVLVREPEERVFFRGEWYEGLLPRAGIAREDAAALGRFEARMREFAGRRDARGRRAFDLPRRRSSPDREWAELDRLSFAAWLEREGLTGERLRWFAEYGTRDDFGTTLEQTSAWAGIHYYAARLATAESESADVLTWPEGNGRLVSHLAALAGPRLRTRALVLDVTPRDGVVDVTWLDAARGETVLTRAEHVVCALPRFLAARVLSPWRAQPPAFLKETVYAPWMVANLTLSDRPRGHGYPLAWDNVLYGSPSLGYVVATHQAGRDHGATVFTYYLPLCDDDPRRAREEMLATNWETWVARIVEDLRRAHPGLEALLERVDVYLWGHAMVRPHPGFLWGQALADSARPLGRVHFAHTDLSGMALFEEAQDHGLRAAEAILRARRATFRSWLD
ncbi:MAG: NAD(P)-binding protein [Vicinamibacteria bacterium]|nr:NAD(P)-binding protein [Vicinamibacteria bacterium]